MRKRSTSTLTASYLFTWEADRRAVESRMRPRHGRVGGCEKDSEAVLGVWLPAPPPTPRALPDHGAIWPLAVGVEKDLGGIDV